MKKLKSLPVVKTAFTIALIALIIGIIWSLIYVTTGNAYSIGLDFMQGWNEIDNLGIENLPLVSVIIAPILDFVFWFIGTLIVVLVYNFVAKKFPLELNI